MKKLCPEENTFMVRSWPTKFEKSLFRQTNNNKLVMMATKIKINGLLR